MGSTKKEFRIAIIGGGIAGVSLAFGLCRRGLNVALYEQAGSLREIGAGLNLRRNAAQAMQIISPHLFDAFEALTIKAQRYSDTKVVFANFLDGESRSHSQELLWTVYALEGGSGVHRAVFLEAIVKLLPPGISSFRKRLVRLSQDSPSGQISLTFTDGAVERADVVIGCDGIRSTVRRSVVGDDHPSCSPTYTHKYAYRGLIDKAEADKVIKTTCDSGNESSGLMRVGYKGHVLTFPIHEGKTLNLEAFRQDDGDWPEPANSVRQATRDELVQDFSSFGKPVIDLLSLTKPELDCWAIFDIPHMPYYSKGRLCVTGDAAHASSPHCGAGGGFALEDAALLCELLADSSVQTLNDVEVALSTYNTARRPRTQWLVENSRATGDLYDYMDPTLGGDLEKMRETLQARLYTIDHFDVSTMCQEGKQSLREAIKATGQ